MTALCVFSQWTFFFGKIFLRKLFSNTLHTVTIIHKCADGFLIITVPIFISLKRAVIVLTFFYHMKLPLYSFACHFWGKQSVFLRVKDVAALKGWRWITELTQITRNIYRASTLSDLKCFETWEECQCTQEKKWSELHDDSA